jgi:hypothetical protein
MRVKLCFQVNISWNSITSAGCTYLKEGIDMCRCLVEFMIGHNGVCDEGAQTLFDTIVAHNKLEALHVEACGMTDVAAVLLAYCVRRSSSLMHVDAHGNWLGIGGCRSLLRISRFKMRQNVSFKLVLGSSLAPRQGDDMFLNDFPNGPYKLNLAVLKQRAIASELWEKAARGPSGQENWRGEMLDRKSIHIPEDEHQPWVIPAKGILEVVFSSFNHVPTMDKVLCDDVFRQVLSDLRSLQRGDLRLACLMAVYCEEFCSCAQLKQMLQLLDDSALRVKFASFVFSRIVDPSNKSIWTRMLSSSARCELQLSLGPLYTFDPSFPSGRYLLDLSNHCQRSLAVKLQECGNAENSWGSKAGLPDTSQAGNCQRIWRNVTLDSKSFVYVGNWAIPDRGILALDYVSLLPVDSGRVDSLEMKAMDDSYCLMLKRELVERFSTKAPRDALLWLYVLLCEQKLQLTCQHALFLATALPPLDKAAPLEPTIPDGQSGDGDETSSQSPSRPRTSKSASAASAASASAASASAASASAATAASASPSAVVTRVDILHVCHRYIPFTGTFSRRRFTADYSFLADLENLWYLMTVDDEV